MQFLFTIEPINLSKSPSYISILNVDSKFLNKIEKIESGSDFLHHSYWNMFENFNKQIKEILKEVKE